MPLTLPGRFAGVRVDSLVAPDAARFEGRRRSIAFAVVGIASYALAMIATLPASVFLKNHPWRTGIAGTIWNGEVGVSGGSKLEWDWAPLRSLTSLGFAADWKATGPDTDLGGRALARPGRVVLDTVSGSAHAALLQALQPNLPFTCDLTMQVEMDRIALGGGSMMHGLLKTGAGTCTPKRAGAASNVPPLLLTAEKIGSETRIRLTPEAQRRRTLVEAVLNENGALTIRMTPEGATALPFVGLPAGASIQGQI